LQCALFFLIFYQSSYAIEIFSKALINELNNGNTTLSFVKDYGISKPNITIPHLSQLIKATLKKGSDSKEWDSLRQNFLHLNKKNIKECIYSACFQYNCNLIRLFLPYDLRDFNDKGSYRETPLNAFIQGVNEKSYVEDEGIKPCIILLLENGCKIEAITQEGLTPLLLACFTYKFKTAIVLVDKGANVLADLYGTKISLSALHDLQCRSNRIDACVLAILMTQLKKKGLTEVS